MLLICFYEINKKHFVRLMLKYYITEKYYYLLFIIYYLLFITLLFITFSNSLEFKIITITYCVHIYNRFFVSLLSKHATDYVIHEIDARFYSDNNRTMNTTLLHWIALYAFCLINVAALWIAQLNIFALFSECTTLM